MNKIIIGVLVILLIVVGYMFYTKPSEVSPGPTNESVTEVPEQATSTPVTDKSVTTIGQSVEGRDIKAYHYGTGSTEILFIGDIHGGYTWNTALLAYKAMDYFKENPDRVPANVTVTVIPVLNPDGLNRVVGTTTANFTQAQVTATQVAQTAGRFNAHTVDLNRNFDCDWKPSAQWQGMTVSGGSEAFSEPESRAVREYLKTHTPKAVVAWYSSAGGVFASSCGAEVSLETRALTAIYAKATGYKAYESYNVGEIPGDMVNWLAKQGIPAISVLLTNHTDIEWTKNQAGIDAVIARYAK
jgi:hypothetical protein